MADQTSLPSKKDVARSLLLRGSVFVHLDPRTDGVAVPTWLCDQPQLVLQIGLDMPIPIPDLRVDDKGVFGTLSFNRQSFTCTVPWDAVFAVVGDDGKWKVWPESMPPEIAAEVEREARRTKLRSVPPPGASTGMGTDASPDEDVSAPKTGAAPMPIEVPALSPHDLGEFDEPGDLSPPVPVENSRRGKGSAQTTVSSRPSSSTTGRKKPVKLPPYLRVVK